MKIRNTIWIVFAICWIALLLIEYLQKHPLYFTAFEAGLYLDLLLIKVAAAGTAGWLVSRYFMKTKSWLRGISLVAWTIIWLAISLAVYDIRKLEPAGLELSVLPALGKLLLFAGGSFLVLVVAWAAGHLLLRRSRLLNKVTHPSLLSLASGIMLLCFILFLLGLAGLLDWIFILPVFLVLIALERKAVSSFLQDLFWTRAHWKPGSAGWRIFFLILIADLVALNAMQAATPMPKGFDALTYYANLPRLIAENASLIGGFQPYNWSLLQSTGWILYDSPEVSNLLSFSGGLMALFAFYSLLKIHSPFRPRWILFTALLWYSLPAVFTQSAFELKVDLGLLFIQLVILHTALDALGKHGWKQSHGGWPFMLVFGLLLGFSMGIKFTSVYFIVALLLIFWFKKEREWLLIPPVLIAIGLILLLQLDDISGMGAWHRGKTIVSIVLLLAGLAGLVYYFGKEKGFIRFTLGRQLAVLAIAALAFAPWPLRNAATVEKLDSRSLLFGEREGPDISKERILRNWEEYKKKGGVQ